jgi:hypothetical protein
LTVLGFELRVFASYVDTLLCELPFFLLIKNTVTDTLNAYTEKQ